ncbi:MAG: hypothetical protein COB38_04615 [Gammaproteobacteria bacterium]|nr:MAG: hypothetical protein COB38_04615 [Gammaproteobacteria bacterium]
MKSPSKTNLLSSNNSNELTDSESNKLVDEVATLLSGDCDLVVDKDVEKQIFAFLHRELSENSDHYVEEDALVPELQFAGTLNPKQWWSRLALPSFVAGGFVLTVLAFQVLWQPLFNNTNQYDLSEMNAELNSQTEIKQHLIEFVIDGEDPSNEISKVSLSRFNREKNKLNAMADFNENKKMPEMDMRITDSADENILSENTVRKGFIYVEPTQINNRIVVNETLEETNNNKVYTGSELSKTPFAEKEGWFKSIVASLQKQEIDIARKEIIRFKSAYPHYKIEDKLKKLDIFPKN